MHKILTSTLLVIFFINCKQSTPCSPFDSSCNPLGYFLPDLIRPRTVGTNPASVTFSGASNLRILSATSVELKWTAATSTASGTMSYLIYSSNTTGTQNFSTPLLTVNNVTTATITGITANTNNYFVVRARDSAGTTDTNTIERAALLNGLIRFIPLDATPLATGERIGNGLVTAFNTPTLTATDRFGVANNSYALDSTSQYFTYSLTLPISVSGGSANRTVCAWAKTNSTAVQQIVGYGITSVSNAFNLRIRSISGIYHIVYDAYGQNGFNSPPINDPANNWNFYCTLSRNSGAVVGFQINSSFSESANNLIMNTNITTIATIGRMSETGGGAEFFNGNIAEVSIWNRALTAAELQAVFKN
jgi:hypothetical protein